tara:strand:- start:3910 stop:5241 length:1332 start_codon:yes stop_codon:yes gene_type:complete
LPIKSNILNLQLLQVRFISIKIIEVFFLKIAVVGSGISGLVSAYLLHHEHEVTVFENASEVGGHTATKDVELEGQNYSIDTGFIVFNDWTYPNFIKLLDQLGVGSQNTDMSFSVSSAISDLEYGGSNLNTLFAQRRNVLSFRFWGMLRDILRFNRESIEDLDAGEFEERVTLGEYLKIKNYGEAFSRDYLIPMGSAIWSASTEAIFNFPMLLFVRFFKNHGLLSVNDRPQWRVIKGGSREYLEPLTKGFACNIRTNTDIEQVNRTDHSVTIVFRDGGCESFDQLIFACHSDQALALLADSTADEFEILSAIPYQQNDVVLHTDERLLPDSRRAWSAWNYRLCKEKKKQAVLTYNMNLLQGIEAPATFCVTLNATGDIDPEKILGCYSYSHPVFSLSSEAATERWHEINGVNRTWFCGAYWGNGFHEDGVNSGIRVAQSLGAKW